MEQKNLKLYYSIHEVAAQFGVNESALRYWEKVFPHLKPKTLANGTRQYTDKDIEELKVIYNLVKVRGYKLEAAKKILARNKMGAERNTEVMTRLLSAKEKLVALKHQFDQLDK